MKIVISLFVVAGMLLSGPIHAADSTFQDYQNYNHGYCPSCNCLPCACGNNPDGCAPPAPCADECAPPNPCADECAPGDPCAPVDPCNPCGAPACGTLCGVSICAVGVAVAAVAAAAAIIISSGNGHSHS